MRTELALDGATGELRAATLENGRVVALELGRARSLREETILQARVTATGRAGAAFFDLGGGRSGFLDRTKAGLREGDSGFVQLRAAPDETGKGWPLRAPPVLVGRYATLSPGGSGLASSGSPALAPRHNGIEAALGEVAKHARITLRRAAAGVPDAPVLAEIRALLDKADTLGEPGGAPAERLAGPDPLTRMLRDAPPAPARVRVEGRSLLAEAQRTAANWPDIAQAIEPWREPDPLFETIGAEEALETVMSGRLALPSGGRITLEDTQAGGVIDVDAGSAVGSRLAVDLEAAEAVAFLVRLAGLGGLVLVDFLNLDRKTDRRKLVAALDAALSRDPLQVQRSEMTAHGIVSLVRPRRRPSLREILLEHPSPRPTLETQALALLRRAEREAAKGAKAGVLVLEADDALADWLAAGDSLAILENRTGRPVRLARTDAAAAGTASVRIASR